MSIHKFIKTHGPDGARIGYFVPRLYQIVWSWSAVKHYGIPYVKDRLTGWTVWWVSSEEDYIRAIKTLDELKKTHVFDYKVCW